jgi:hypothetical protein
LSTIAVTPRQLGITAQTKVANEKDTTDNDVDQRRAKKNKINNADRSSVLAQSVRINEERPNVSLASFTNGCVDDAPASDCAILIQIN